MLIELVSPQAFDIRDPVVEAEEIFFEFLPLLLLDLDEHVVGALLELLHALAELALEQSDLHLELHVLLE